MKKIIMLLLVICIAFGFTACKLPSGGGGGTGELSSDEKTVDVKLYKAGYGIGWFQEAAKKFEEAYKTEGYKINLYEASNTVSATTFTEVQNVKTNNIDLFFVSGMDISAYIKRSAAILKSNDKTLIENLNDVYSSKAIDFEGNEESITIEEKLQSSNSTYYKFQGCADSSLDKWKGNYYVFPWASGPAGLFVNKNVLSEFNLSIPRTTNELIEQYQTICPDNNGEPTPAKTGVYPMTYAGKNAAGYWTYMSDTLFAQYSGVEAVNDFWALNPSTGTTIANGYDVYQDQGILEALKVMQSVTDDNYCMFGTNQLEHTASQRQVLNGNAAYVCSGNWIYNEMSVNYADIVDNLTMIKMPIISALGTKLGITDATLRAVVTAIDDGENDAAIAAANSTAESVVARVREARDVYYSASVDHQAIIPSYSPSKEVAKLFLRFLASDDNLDLYKQQTNSSLPFVYETQSKVEANDFVKSTVAVSGGANATLICENLQASPIRQVGLHSFCAQNAYSTVFLSLSQKTATAQGIWEANYNFAKDNWTTYLRTAGLIN